MKLIILGIVFLLGGIPNLMNPDNLGVGIACTLIGVAIIVGKIITSHGDSQGGSRSVSISNTNVNTDSGTDSDIDQILAYHRAYNDAQPIFHMASAYSGRIQAERSAAQPWKQPYDPKVDDLIRTCNTAIAFYPKIKAANDAIAATMAHSKDYTVDESTFCLFPALECLVDIYIKRKQFDLANNVVQNARSIGLRHPANLKRLDALAENIRYYHTIDTKYPYSMDACIAEVKQRIEDENITVFLPSRAKQFNRSHFQDICKRFDLRNDKKYTFESKCNYSEHMIEYIVQLLKSDEHILEKIRAELKAETPTS